MMKKIGFVFAILFVVSCGNQEDIMLPKSNRTVVKEVVDLSPIYIFFRINGKDTLAEVNRNNSISTTNWVFNIDRRLPLRTVIPEIIKLQERKRKSREHQNLSAQNYYSYADTIGKNLAFLPFTKVFYKLEKPRFGVVIYFAKDNSILVNGELVKRNDLEKFLNDMPSDKPNKLFFCFDKNSSYGSYIQNKLFLASLKVNNIMEEEFFF